MSSLADWRAIYSGKVRELYIPISASNLEDADRLLVVATDRVSAFDHILDPEIPAKGVILTALSSWWFNQLPDVVHHVLDEAPPAELGGRAMVVTPLRMFPIECVVRGYLAGSGWSEYKESGTVGGIALREGLREGDALDEPLFTPATKAALGDHDENISFDRMVESVGANDAHALREASMSIYQRARDIAARRGVILADTKFEFGRNPITGAITLADEILTSDSSRYWEGEIYSLGGINRLDSFDKQLVRNWLADNWDRTGTPPRLPDELVELTRQRYQELFDRLTGSGLEG